jgi:hypothetical protein
LAEEVHLVEEQVLGLQRVALGDVNRRPPERKGSSCRRDIAIGGVEDTIMGAGHDPFGRCGRPVGEELVRVPPKLTVPERRAGRTRGKSDPIDALAIARVALREPDLSRPSRCFAS